MTKKLDGGEINFIGLIVKGRKDDGWTTVSKVLMPLTLKLPSELVEAEYFGEEGKGRARLTEKGQQVYDAMPWFGIRR